VTRCGDNLDRVPEHRAWLVRGKKVRLKLPRGYKIAAHNHPTAEMVTIISGDFHLGMGDKLDEKKGMRLTAVMRKPPPR
jgi:hypothetical protein